MYTYLKYYCKNTNFFANRQILTHFIVKMGGGKHVSFYEFFNPRFIRLRISSSEIRPKERLTSLPFLKRTNKGMEEICI
jgi:hypothetical protein